MRIHCEGRFELRSLNYVTLSSEVAPLCPWHIHRHNSMYFDHHHHIVFITIAIVISEIRSKLGHFVNWGSDTINFQKNTYMQYLCRFSNMKPLFHIFVVVIQDRTTSSITIVTALNLTLPSYRPSQTSFLITTSWFFVFTRPITLLTWHPPSTMTQNYVETPLPYCFQFECYFLCLLCVLLLSSS